MLRMEIPTATVLLLFLAITFSLMTQLRLKVEAAVYKRDECLKGDTPNIPKDHLFYTKKQPLILGHRGQGRKFQENTIEGIKSLIGTGADGFHADVMLTDYGQLVLFHSDNETDLTGKDNRILEMTPDEIKKLKYKKTLKYGSQTYNYDKERSVGLLEDLLLAMNDTDMLIYLEMNSRFWDDKAKSNATGKAVAELIKKHKLEKKVLLTSNDPFKIMAAKKENPKLVTGTYYLNRYWEMEPWWYADVKGTMRNFRGLGSCLDPLQNSSSIMDLLLQTGSYEKSVNASFIELEFGLFSDKKVWRDPVKTLKDNYNKHISFGVVPVYNIAFSECEVSATESKVQNLIDKGVARLITDDVPRLMKKLGRKKPIKSSVTRIISSLVNIFIGCLFSIYTIGL